MVAISVQQDDGFSWGQRDLKLLEKQREAFAGCLYESLLAGPKDEKGFSLNILWKSMKQHDFSRGEESLGDLVICQMSLYVFEIDAQFSAAAYRNEGKPLGVGQVEAEFVFARLSGQGRLAMRAVAKSHLTWVNDQVAPEDGPEQPAGNNKAITVFVEMIAPGPP